MSNLQLQKLMYLTQMIYMGRHEGMKLFSAGFEAWDYGPVIPDLYHKLKGYGAEYVHNVFDDALIFKLDDQRRQVMDSVCEKFLQFDAGQLVEITHWEKGAWAAHYVPRARHIRIPDKDIWDEYRARQPQ
ncbi:MAG: type II toxin-antitoxin system antitoxin SocA domain-containing protein [Aestuariivirga sp.]